MSLSRISMTSYTKKQHINDEQFGFKDKHFTQHHFRCVMRLLTEQLNAK